MSLLQFLAADLAGINRLVFHTLNREGTEAFSQARKLYGDIIPRREKLKVDDVLNKIEQLGFKWGVPDGN